MKRDCNLCPAKSVCKTGTDWRGTWHCDNVQIAIQNCVTNGKTTLTIEGSTHEPQIKQLP